MKRSDWVLPFAHFHGENPFSWFADSPLPRSPGLLDIPIRRLSDTDRNIAFFIHHPGVVKLANEANREEKAAQILRRDPDRNDYIVTVAGRGMP